MSLVAKAGNLPNDTKIKLRSEACQLMIYSLMKLPIDISVAKETLQVALRNETRSREMLDLAAELYLKYKSKTSCGLNNPKDGVSYYLEFLSEAMLIYCSICENALAMRQFDQAFDYFAKAENIKKDLPCLGKKLVAISYNFGVDMFDSQNYKQSVKWLQKSRYLAKYLYDLEGSKKARILRLLANAYIHWDIEEYYEMAWNAVEDANNVCYTSRSFPTFILHSHPFGFYLKLKLSFQRNHANIKEIHSTVELAFNLPDMTINMGLSFLELVKSHDNLYTVANAILRMLCIRFDSSMKVIMVKIALLERLINGGELHEAKQLVEGLVEEQNKKNKITSQMLKKLKFLLQNQAYQFYQVGKFSEATEWYNFCLHLAKESEMELILSLLINLSCCHIMRKEFNEAQKAVDKGKNIQPSCPFMYYLEAKIGLMANDSKKVMNALSDLVNLEVNKKEDKFGLVCVILQISMKQNSLDVVGKALHYLTASNSLDYQNLIVFLKFYIMLLLKANWRIRDCCENIIYCFDEAHKIMLNSLSSQKVNLSNDAVWFMKAAWNMALKNRKLATVEQLNRYFVLSYQFSTFCPETKVIVSHQMICLIMDAATKLRFVNESLHNNIEERRMLVSITEIGTKFFQNRRILTKLNDDFDKSMKNLTILMLLYEIEAFAKLDDLENLMKPLDTLLDLSLDVPVLSHIAAIMRTFDLSEKYVIPQLKILDCIYRLCLPNENDNDKFKSLCILQRSILTSLIDKNFTDINISDLLWSKLKQFLDVVIKRRKHFAEKELIWFIIKCWNKGWERFAAMKYRDGEKWCSVSIKVLNLLPKCNYILKGKIMKYYPDIVSKIE
ncbi:Testis-expressed sequence 11 protein [Trichoplax sp. H2]|nr:Testis-expressed sequence 11 protein [Trichoplax sp. H2]|eukprot:RDD46816.1 Testis-expressed sequence 11 protein [Trichoplax sp. H2]